MPKYPNITIKLTGLADNRFAVVIACLRTLRENSLGHELDTLATDMKNGGENIIATVGKWFNVE